MESKRADLEMVKHGLERLHAAMWDRHYGEGLAVKYARGADADYRSALAALSRLEAQQSPGDQQRATCQAMDSSLPQGICTEPAFGSLLGIDGVSRELCKRHAAVHLVAQYEKQEPEQEGRP